MNNLQFNNYIVGIYDVDVPNITTYTYKYIWKYIFGRKCNNYRYLLKFFGGLLF